MYKKICFLFFFCSAYILAEHHLPYLTSENDTLALIDGVVNAYNGKLVQMDQDIVIQGSDPLEMTRYYDGGHPFSSEFGFGVGGPFPTMLSIYPNCAANGVVGDQLFASVELRMGGELVFEVKDKKIDGVHTFNGLVSSTYFKTGYTNCCEALLRGEPSIHAMSITWTNWDMITVDLGNGTKRYYEFHFDALRKGRFYLLKSEHRANGNWRHYSYTHEYGGTRLKRIWTTNQDDTLTLNWLNFHYTGPYVYVRGSNGQEACYTVKLDKGSFETKETDQRKSGSWKKVRLISASVDHAPAVEYDKVDKSFFKNAAFCTKKVRKSHDQFLQVQYNVMDRISHLFVSGVDFSLYHFNYFGDSTYVGDSRGAGKLFTFEQRRLVKLEEDHRVQYYEWDHKGQLTTHKIKTRAKGKEKEATLCTRTYQYDKKGNLIESALKGSITELNSNDSDKIYYTYSALNQVLTKTHGDLLITYSYHPNHRQVSSQLTSHAGKIQEREFFTYDKNAILICKIVDDGSSNDVNNLDHVTYRLITEIEPQLNPDLGGLTLPHITKELYQDLQGAKHLLKKTECLYLGDLLIEEKIFDANEIYQYSRCFEYNERRELIRKTNALGVTTLYTYDDNGNQICKEKNGKKNHSVYDLANRLVEEREEHLDITLTTRHSYDLMGNRISTTDPYGQTTHYTIDLIGREIAQKDPLGKKEYKQYNALGFVTGIQDKEGYLTWTDFNLLGDPLETRYPDGSSKKCRYTLKGDLIEEWKADGTHLLYTVDYKGRIQTTQTLSAEGSLIKTEQKIYKGAHLIKEIDGMGHEINYLYDAGGRQTAKIQGEIQTFYEYDTLGRCCKTILGNRVDAIEYNEVGHPIEERIEDLNGVVYSKKQYAYDAMGNCILLREFSSNENFTETQSRYNSQNQLILEIDALGHETRYIYHQTDHLEKESIDALGRHLFEIYDPLNRLKEVKILSAEGTLLSHSCFSYDRRGHQIQRTEAVLLEGIPIGTYEIKSVYDSMGQKIAESEQNLKTTHWTYEKGRLLTIQTPDNILLTHRYDALGRLHEQISSDGTIHYRYLYDLNDNLIQADNLVACNTIVRTYDALNRMVYEKQAYGFECFFTYDEQHRLTHLNFLDRTLLYTYSPLGLSSCTRYQNNQALYQYSQTLNLSGRIMEAILPNQSTLVYQWDALKRCKKIESSSYSQALCYDAIGNLKQTSIKDGLGLYTAQFSYDSLNQLIREESPFSADYQYDSLYNRVQQNSLLLNLDALNQLVSDATTHYSYDLNGRRVSKNSDTYSYDAMGRLLSFNETTYQYDALGRRVAKLSADHSTTYIYSLDAEMGAYSDGELIEFCCLYKSVPLAIELANVLYTPIRNHRGDVCQLLRGDGVAGTYRYDAFGVPSLYGTDCPWLFSAQRYDRATELYHFEHREYDPAIGRWLTPDPLGFADGPNLYAYVQNNPLIYIDPQGLFFEEIRDFLHGSARGAVDDLSWGASERMLGTYQAPSISGQIGYYTGTAASMVAGLTYGVTGARLLKGAYSLIKKAPTAMKYANRLSQSYKFTQITKQSSHVKSTIQSVDRSAKQIKPSSFKSMPNIDVSSKSGQIVDRSGLTKAGRALDKHGGRVDSPFPKATGNEIAKNTQGQYHLDDILTHPQREVLIKNDTNNYAIYAPDGRGACFRLDGKFRGFMKRDYDK